MNGSFEDQSWHVVWTHVGAEHRVWRGMHDLDLGPYLPRAKRIEVRHGRHSPGRKIEVESARYPGYVFVLVGSWRPSAWDQVHAIDGFGGFLKHGEHLAVISGMQLASAILQDILDAIRSVNPGDPLFTSRRKLRREARYRAFLARKDAA